MVTTDFLHTVFWEVAYLLVSGAYNFFSWAL